uniref:CxC1 domain-containing protein n=1 Tax=Macrostomum lignano TaxID=282301 RepID=A0A1I8HMS9_9PLAT
GQVPEERCPFCRSGSENAEHFICHCPVFTRARLTHLGPNPVLSDVCRPESIPLLARYLRDTGRADFFPTVGEEDRAAGETDGSSSRCPDPESDLEHEGAVEPLDDVEDDEDDNNQAERSRFKEFCEAESDRWDELLSTGTLADVNEIPIKVEVCSCTTYREALLTHGFWPIQARPENARLLTAVAIGLLLLIDCLNSQCTASLSSLCAALRHFRNSMWIPTTLTVDLFRTLNVNGSFRAFRSVLQSLRRGQNASCPACHVKNETSDNPSPVFLMMDACFGIRHRRNAGKATMPPASGFFIDVDHSNGVQPSEGHCANWSAGGRGQGLTSGAELIATNWILNYSECMVQQMLRDIPPHVPIIVSYDISCKLAGRFCDPRLTFVLPALHVYGHVLRCQLLFGIRATESVGLIDGESVERIWPPFRRFGPQVKEMAQDNRRNFLNYVADTMNFARIMSIRFQQLLHINGDIAQKARAVKLRDLYFRCKEESQRVAAEATTILSDTDEDYI